MVTQNPLVRDQSISGIFTLCLTKFDALLSSVWFSSAHSPVSQSLWEDERGRLRVWAANIGAHQKGQSSLDYRLRDASHVKDQIAQLLTDLNDQLNALEEALEDPQPESLFEEFEVSEIQQIHQAVAETITCLYQMTMAIRRPSRHDHFQAIRKKDIEPYIFYDRQHVSNKFPKASNTISDRLGAAISRRRAVLQYRERHHAKLSAGIGGPADEETLSATLATEYRHSLALDDTKSWGGASQTSYGTTLLNSEAGKAVPPPPEESADGKPFECPYCYYIITIDDDREWFRHVLHDLIPYVCLSGDCLTPQKLYVSRRECAHHMRHEHSMNFDQQPQHCPLCYDLLGSSEALRHIGEHLVELALFALPTRYNEAELPVFRGEDAVERLPQAGADTNGPALPNPQDGKEEQSPGPKPESKYPLSDAEIPQTSEHPGNRRSKRDPSPKRAVGQERLVLEAKIEHTPDAASPPDNLDNEPPQRGQRSSDAKPWSRTSKAESYSTGGGGGRSKTALWICCQCSEGPKLYPSCVECGHNACGACVPVE